MFVITMIVCVNISLKAHSSIFVMYVGHSVCLDMPGPDMQRLFR